MAASSAGKRNRTPRHGSADINSVCHWLLHQAHDCLASKSTPQRRRCHITRAGTAFPEIPGTVSSRMWMAQHTSPQDGMPTGEIIIRLFCMGDDQLGRVNKRVFRPCGPEWDGHHRAALSSERRTVSRLFPLVECSFSRAFKSAAWADTNASPLAWPCRGCAAVSGRADLLHGGGHLWDWVGRHLDRRKWWVEDRVVGERERPFEAKSLVWQTPSGEYGGEWVFFLRFRGGGMWTCSATKLDSGALLPELWTIYNNSLERDTLNVCISSFRWLSEEFFRSLPAHP